MIAQSYLDFYVHKGMYTQTMNVYTKALEFFSLLTLKTLVFVLSTHTSKMKG